MIVSQKVASTSLTALNENAQINDAVTVAVVTSFALTLSVPDEQVISRFALPVFFSFSPLCQRLVSERFQLAKFFLSFF